MKILLQIKKKIFEKFNKKKNNFDIILKQDLFDGNYELLLDCVNENTIFGEYGAGKSTIYLAQNYKFPIYSVETSKEFKDLIKTKIKDRRTTFKVNSLFIIII